MIHSVQYVNHSIGDNHMAKQAKYQAGQEWSGTYRGANQDDAVTVKIVDATQKESRFKFDTTPAYTVVVTTNGVKAEPEHYFEGELEGKLRTIGAK
jgi:hypothetical protein